MFGMGTGGPSALEALTISFNEAFYESHSLKTEQSEDCVERNSSKINEPRSDDEKTDQEVQALGLLVSVS